MQEPIKVVTVLLSLLISPISGFTNITPLYTRPAVKTPTTPTTPKYPPHIHHQKSPNQHNPFNQLSSSSSEAQTDPNNNNNSVEGTATIPDEIFNLVKCIVGAGVLSLPAGISAFGNAPSALIPATILIALMGGISAYTFSMIARVCSLTGATSYSDAWDKTRGTKTAWIVATSSALDCFAGIVSYSMILADTSKDLLAAAGVAATRSQALVGLTGSVLLPLCLVKNLARLAPFSLVGIMGMLYTSVAIGVRYFGGAYAAPSGRFLGELAPHLQPSFGSVGALGALSPKSLILISMLSTSYIAHFNAPKFYRELKNNTMKRFNTVVTSSFSLSVALYAAVSAMAFLTFGSATNGMILNNYATSDVLLSLSRFAVGLSLVFSYPLLFVGTRDGLLDMIRMKDEKRTNSFINKLSVALLAVTTLCALKITDLTFVASISGAVLGTALIFIFPPLMFRAAVKENPTKGQKWERRLCAFIASMGVAIGGVGAKMALNAL